MHSRTTAARRLAALIVFSVALSACSVFNPNPPVVVDPAAVRGAAGATPAKRPKPLRPTVDWKRCGKDHQCARLAVPMDYSRPKGKKVKLALIRLPAPNPKRRIGSLIVNPGGPGGSGVDFVRFGALQSIPAEVRVRFDIVSFDPRGVARSDEISCADGAPQAFLANDLVPDSSVEVASLLRAAETLAESCGAAGGELLEHMATANVARDLDRIRRAVGDRQLTYLGYSYGTTIGLRYAEQFPRNIRALVLDGPVDPAQDGLQRARDQAVVLEKTLREFFRECPKRAACRGFAENLTLRRFNAMITRLETDAVPAYRFPGRQLRSSEALLATAMMLKDRGTGWPLLAAGLEMAEGGDGSLLLGVAESTMFQERGREQWLAPLLAVNCLDIPAPRPAEYAPAAAKLAKQSEHFGGLMLLLSSPCAFWPEEPQRQPEVVRAPKAPPMVVIGTTGDPTTPYQWAERVARNLRSARLVKRDGAGHTAFGKVNVCTDRTVTAYLVNLVLPADGQGCS